MRARALAPTCRQAITSPTVSRNSPTFARPPAHPSIHPSVRPSVRLPGRLPRRKSALAASNYEPRFSNEMRSVCLAPPGRRPNESLGAKRAPFVYSKLYVSCVAKCGLSTTTTPTTATSLNQRLGRAAHRRPWRSGAHRRGPPSKLLAPLVLRRAPAVGERAEGQRSGRVPAPLPPPQVEAPTLNATCDDH